MARWCLFWRFKISRRSKEARIIRDAVLGFVGVFGAHDLSSTVIIELPQSLRDKHRSSSVLGRSMVMLIVLMNLQRRLSVPMSPPCSLLSAHH
jgi:hypothetical protein